MAHPFKEHRANKVQHSRVGKMVRDYEHSDMAQDKKLIKKMLVQHEAEEMDNGRARGGRAPKAKGTNVNIIIGSGGPSAPPSPPLAGVGGPGPVPPRPPMPPAPPPGAAPGGPPPPGAALPPGLMGMRSAGGRAFARGGAVKDGPGWTESMKARKPFVVASGNNKNDGKDIGRGRVITYKTGGPVEHPLKGGMGPKFPGGGRGGMARLAKAHRAARNYKKA